MSNRFSGDKRMTVSIALLALGLTMLVLGIVAGTTGLFKSLFNLGRVGVWKIAGVLAGIGVPMSIFGVFNVLPATRKQRFGAIAGLLLSSLGVIMFVLWYPSQWYGDPTDNTFISAGTYALGAFLTVGYLFISVANADTSGGVRRRPRAQQAQSFGTLVKNLLSIATNDTEIPNLDMEEVLEDIEEDMGDDIKDSMIEDGMIRLLRSDSVSHAEFKISLPQYAEIQDREGGVAYTLSIDNEVYSLV